MSNISTKLSIIDFVSSSQLKKKIKNYLNDVDCSHFKLSTFSKGLIISLVMVLEELLSDSLKYIIKDETNGLYKISYLILNTTINENSKYNFIFKYLKSYTPIVQYTDSVLFNIKKVLDNLESKYGSKLMIEHESKNLLSYIILSLQYDLINLGINMAKYSKKKTLTIKTLVYSLSFIISKEISKKIELKLDSLDEDKNTELDEDKNTEIEIDDESNIEIDDNSSILDENINE